VQIALECWNGAFILKSVSRLSTSDKCWLSTPDSAGTPFQRQGRLCGMGRHCDRWKRTAAVGRGCNSSRFLQSENQKFCSGGGCPKKAIEKTILRFLGTRTFSHGLGREPSSVRPIPAGLTGGGPSVSFWRGYEWSILPVKPYPVRLVMPIRARWRLSRAFRRAGKVGCSAITSPPSRDVAGTDRAMPVVCGRLSRRRCPDICPRADIGPT
jgi:hypothetical protein